MSEDIASLKERILEQLDELPEEQAEAMRERIEGMSDADFEAFLKEYTMPLQSCLFCQLAQGKIPTIRIYESKNILAVLDINPAAKGHMLVMPKQHYQFLTQLPDSLLFEIFSFVKHIIPSIIRAIKSQGVALSILQGKEQAVPHFAVSIIPRFKEDKINFSQKRQKIPQQELEAIAAEIRTDAGRAVKKPLQAPEEKTGKFEKPIKQKQESIEEPEEAEEKDIQENEKIPNAGISEEELEKFFRGRIPS
mgnify:CR=1 FL=1